MNGRSQFMRGTLVLLLAVSALAQEAPAPERAPDTNSREAQNGVTVRDSPEAAKKLDTAQHMERQRDWAKAAGWYQEVLEQYPDRVVPARANDKNVIDQYTSITLTVQQSLAHWPADGLATYRARYEPVAAEMLRQARHDDYETLNKVYQKYFVTEAAKQSGMRLIDLYLEAGDFAAAAWLGDRLLSVYPDLGEDRARVLHRTALAYHLAGDEPQALTRADELADKFPTAMGEIFATQVVLNDNLRQQLKVAPPVAQAQASDSWPMLGGDASRARVSTATGLPTAHLYSVDLPRTGTPLPNTAQGAEVQRAQAASMVPAIDRGELYFQDGMRCFAVNLETGRPLAGWAQTYPNGGYFSAVGVGETTPQQTTVTLTDNEVLAVMGQASRNHGRYPGVIPNENNDNDPGTRLVCLDRRTGKLKWSVAPRQLKDELASVDFGGAPLVVGGRVYVMGRGGTNFQFEDCYALCFDLQNGLDPLTQKPRWSCFICSSNAPTEGWDEGMGGLSSAPSHMAYADGRLYVLSNLGALAAVDAYNGIVVWLSIYPRDVTADASQGGIVRRNWPGRSNGGGQLWESGPVLAHDRKLFLLPADAASVYVYDALSGQCLRSLPLKSFPDTEHIEGPCTLLAVVGDHMLLAGQHELWSARWTDYHEGKDDWVDWISFKMQPSTNDASRIRGLPFVTTQSIFVPIQEYLAQVGMIGGKLMDDGKYPPDIRVSAKIKAPRTWADADLGPGNVVVAGEYVVVAGDHGVDVYSTLERVRARLDAQIAAAGPGVAGAAARLGSAEVLFSSGDLKTAADQLRGALALLSPATHEADAQRDRLFTDAINFAQKLATYRYEDLAIMDAVRPLSGPFFEIAGTAANNASQQVNYRISRARLAAASFDTATAVRLYQEILANPEMRLVALSQDDPNGGVVQAALLAEFDIAALIKNNAAAYAPFAAQAKAALDAARAAHDPAALLEVAQTYPNAAGVAADALWSAEQEFEAAGKPRLAAQVLRALAAQPLETPQRGRVLEAMVRNYLALGDHTDVALGRLRRASDNADLATYRFAQPLHLPNGKMLDHPGFAEAYAALRDARAQLPPPVLPDFHLPVMPGGDGPFSASVFRPESAQEAIAGVGALVEPPGELREYASDNRVVTWSQTNNVSVYAVGQNKAMYTGHPLHDAPVGLAWTAQDRVLVWSAKEIALVAVDGGQNDRVWNCALSGLAPIQMVCGLVAGRALAGQEIAGLNLNAAHVQARQDQAPADADDGEQIALVRPAGDHIIVCTNTGRVVSLSAGEGRAQWQTRLSNRAPDTLLASSDFVAVRVAYENLIELIVLDSGDGRLLARRNFNGESGMVPLNLALSNDGVLVWTMPDQMYAKDLYEPGATLRFPTDEQLRAMPNHPQGQQPQPLYANCDKRDQLLIVDGQILALQKEGQFLSIRSLQTGEMVRAPLSTLTTGINNGGAPDVPVVLRKAEPYVYAIGTHLAAYNLDAHNGSDSWTQNLQNGQTLPNVRAVFLGSDHLVLLDVPMASQNTGNYPTQEMLHIYSRQHQGAQNRESGNEEPGYTINNVSGIQQWQPVNGGFYYLSGDGMLHFLHGVRD